MDIIESIIVQTENKINKELLKVNRDIDFNPFEEAIKIHKAVISYLNDDGVTSEEFEKLKVRESKNQKDIKRTSNPKYLDKLFIKQGDLERQLNEVFKLRLMARL